MLVRERILEERKRNGLSTAGLAELLHVHKATVNRWEIGKVCSIPADMMRQLADIFHLSLDELIGDDPEYAYLLSKEKRHTVSVRLSEEEKSMINWYRLLTPKEKKLIRKLWQNT